MTLVTTNSSKFLFGYMKGALISPFSRQTAACCKHWVLYFEFPDESVKVEGDIRREKLIARMTERPLYPNSPSPTDGKTKVHEAFVTVTKKDIGFAVIACSDLGPYSLFTNNCQHCVLEFLNYVDIKLPPNIAPWWPRDPRLPSVSKKASPDSSPGELISVRVDDSVRRRCTRTDSTERGTQAGTRHTTCHYVARESK